MKQKILLLAIYFLAFLSNSAYAAISVVSIEEDPDVVSYSKIALEKKESFFVTSRMVAGKPMVRMSSIARSPNKSWEVEIPFLAVFLAPGRNTDLLIGANANGEWIASRIDARKRIAREAKLSDFAVVTGVAVGENGYVVSGRNASGKPKVIALNRDLLITRSFLQTGDLTGEANVVSSVRGTTILVINYSNGSSSITWLSNTLSLIREVALGGGAASGIPFEDGMAVTYSLDKDVFIEALDRDGRSKWKKLVHRRNGASSLKYELCTVTNGLGVIGSNNSMLVVTRVERDGTIISATTDKSGLLPPTDSRYVVDTNGNEIHILGAAIKAGSDAHAPPYLFHFVERHGN